MQAAHVEGAGNVFFLGRQNACIAFLSRSWPLIPSLQQTVHVLQHLPYAGSSLPSIAYKRSSLRIELCLSNMHHLPELNTAQSVRASDRHSEDPGSNPGWISPSFYLQMFM